MEVIDLFQKTKSGETRLFDIRRNIHLRFGELVFLPPRIACVGHLVTMLF